MEQRHYLGSRASPQHREAEQGSCTSLSGFLGRAQKKGQTVATQPIISIYL